MSDPEARLYRSLAGWQAMRASLGLSGRLGGKAGTLLGRPLVLGEGAPGEATKGFDWNGSTTGAYLQIDLGSAKHVRVTPHQRVLPRRLGQRFYGKRPRRMAGK